MGGLSTTDPGARRREIAGRAGHGGFTQNRRVFSVAIFASIGGFLYGYNQGVFSGVLPMHSFVHQMGDFATDSGKKGWLVAILELGAWLGVLLSGYLTDKLSRKYTIMLATTTFAIGVIVQATAHNPGGILAGRFIAGLGVGSLSMAAPLYNAEISPPELRGSLVGLQQLANVFGIMVAFWIDFGTNYIGGTGDGQHQAAWRIPLGLQLVSAITLGVGMLFMPFSPRWLVNQGRDEEALRVLCTARQLPPDSELIQIEFLEIRAQHIFERETSAIKFPMYQDGSFSSNFKLGFFDYLNLLTDRSLLYRVAVGSLTMFFQQWSGINAVLYYAPTIFSDLGLTGTATSLLATGVVGIAMFLATFPALIWIDKIGRKPILISGAFVMGAAHLIIAILTARFGGAWQSHKAAGWAACAMVWVYSLAFGYGWGPGAWILCSEIWPLSARGKGMSIAISSNWMNNFIIGQVTPSMLVHLGYGTFIFFGLFSILAGFFVWFMVPETKGLTLEEMDSVFGAGNLAVEDQARQDAIMQRLGLSQADVDVSMSEKKRMSDDDSKA